MDEASKKLVADVRDQLLQGLADDAETIRQVCFLFVFLTASLSLSLSVLTHSPSGGGVSIVNKHGILMFDDCITHQKKVRPTFGAFSEHAFLVLHRKSEGFF